MQSSGLVAPTQKISDDAPYPTSGPSSIPPQNYTPPPQSYPSAPASIPPQNYPSVPPQNYTPTSIPPQNNSYQTGPTSVPPQNNSIPPQNSYQTGPKSIPPQAAQPRLQTAPPVPTPTPQGTPSQPRPKTNGVPSVSRRQPPAPAFSDPSITAPPRRRWGLIITVLVIDLALAGAGVYLLTEGLA